MSALATQHVVIVDDDEINLITASLVTDEVTDAGLARRVDTLANRLQFGDTYANALDERVRLDARKKILRAAAKATEARIQELNEQLAEEWTERGITQERHADSGKLVHRNRGRCFAKVVRAGDDVQPEERQRACDALKADPGTADFVREDFHTGALGAYFKERAEEYDTAQRELPREQRTPRDINDFLPPACVGRVELSDNPTISVRS